MDNFKRIYEIISSECENGCIDHLSTMGYFYQHYAETFLPEEVDVVASNFDYVLGRNNNKKEIENVNR